MRIAHLVAHTDLNGVSTSCRTLINAQLHRGHAVMLVTMPKAWLASQAFDGPIEITSSHLKTRVNEIKRIGGILRQWQPTVVHCHGSKANKYGMVFRIVAGAPVVSTAHSRNIQIPPSFFRAVIAPSQQTADFHRRFNRVSKKRLVVIPHLFEPVKSDHQQAENRLVSLGVEPGDFVIGIVGSIDTRKNQIDALRAFKLVLADHPNTRLVIIGAASKRHPIEGWHDALNETGVRERVILAGHQENAADLIGHFDSLLCTSRIEEGPIVVLEAMSQGVPVVSTTVGMVPWLIRDAVDGFTFDVGDVSSAAKALKTLAGNPKTAVEIGEQGKARLEQMCDETTILEQIDDVYETVARQAGTWSSPGAQR